MAQLRTTQANDRKLNNRMRSASFLIRDGGFTFEVDKSVLENALSVLHSLNETDEDGEDEDEDENEGWKLSESGES
jgi:hypothetical protein